MSRPTLATIARAAGVSTTVVSHVVNSSLGGNVRVSPDTAERVLRAARKAGYRRHAAAASLRTNRTQTIAILGGFHPGEGWLYSGPNLQILVGVSETLAERDEYSLLVHLQQVQHPDGPLPIREGRVDGVIVLEQFTGNLQSLLQKLAVPYIAVNVAPAPQNALYPDDLPPLREALLAWRQRGIQRLVYLEQGWFNPHYSMSSRREAAQRFAAELGMTLQCHTVNSGEVDDVVATVVDDGATGVICYNAGLAQLVSMSLTNLRGDAHPAVLCWATPNTLRMLLPWVEAIVLPLKHMGRLAAKHLIDQVLAKKKPAGGQLVPCRLIKGEAMPSSAAALEKRWRSSDGKEGMPSPKPYVEGSAV